MGRAVGARSPSAGRERELCLTLKLEQVVELGVLRWAEPPAVRAVSNVETELPCDHRPETCSVP